MDNVHFDPITSVDLRASPLHADNTWELIPWFDRKTGRTNSCTVDDNGQVILCRCVVCSVLQMIYSALFPRFRL